VSHRGQTTVLTAAICAAALAVLGGVQAAGAGTPSLTWQQAAARVHTPVYRPRVTLGIKPQMLAVNQGGCVIGAWGSTKNRKGPHFSIDEPANTSQCGQPGEADQVSSATINGKRVPVLVQCPHIPHCTAHDGQTDGVFIMFVPERGPNHYSIQLESSHVALHGLLRIARSFVRVTAHHAAATSARVAVGTPPGPTAGQHFGEFLSPDGKVWCGAGATTFCATGGDPAAPANGPQTLASVAANGKVTLCRVAHSSVSSVCVQNWDDTAPALQVGQSTERNNILCTSAANGITCVIASGPGKGRGFRVSAGGQTRIGPSGPAPAPVPVLGDALGGIQGFGTAHPSALALGNDITGHMTKIRWKHWGAMQASGSGTGYWVPPGKPLSDSRAAPSEIVAFDLGTCHGVRAYLRYKWWLPTHGGTMRVAFANHACL
jgi:hypothetical protein